MKKSMIIASLFMSSVSFATSPVEPTEGAALFVENCTSCHFHDTPELFTRQDRKAKDRAQLSQWVSNCITQTKVEVFPEDEELIEDFLNTKYYKF